MSIRMEGASGELEAHTNGATRPPLPAPDRSDTLARLKLTFFDQRRGLYIGGFQLISCRWHYYWIKLVVQYVEHGNVLIAWNGEHLIRWSTASPPSVSDIAALEARSQRSTPNLPGRKVPSFK
jgi:hypothetical protein